MTQKKSSIFRSPLHHSLRVTPQSLWLPLASIFSLSLVVTVALLLFAHLNPALTARWSTQIPALYLLAPTATKYAYFELTQPTAIAAQATIDINLALVSQQVPADVAVATLEWASADYQYVSDKNATPTTQYSSSPHTTPPSGKYQQVILNRSALETAFNSAAKTPLATLTLKALKANPAPVRLVSSEYNQWVHAIHTPQTVNSYTGQPITVTPTPTSPAASNFAFEAEAGILSGSMIAKSDPSASGGQYILATSAGQAQFSLQTQTTQDYYLWLKIKTSSTSADSFKAQLDTGTIYDVHLPQTQGKWRWSRVPLTTGGTDLSTLSIPAGNHTLTILHRELNTPLDRLILTPDRAYQPDQSPVSTPQASSSPLATPMVTVTPRPTPTPSPRITPTTTPKVTPTPAAQTTIPFEAEAGVLSGKMTKKTDSTASKGAYISSSGTGQATYQLTAPTTTPYYLWLKVIATTDGSNSFTIQLDNQTTYNAHLSLTKSQWQWQRVSLMTNGKSYPTLSIAQGNHAFIVGHREPNTKLDRLVLTTSKNYNPN